jgi:uncharacterized membrane protein YeaQ/YmgE (transglycosylase-associated protein family)
MGLIEILIMLAVAALIGYLGHLIAGGKTRGGLVINVVVGLVGSYVGWLLVNKLGLSPIFTLAGFPVIWGIIGAFLVILAVAMLKRRFA